MSDLPRRSTRVPSCNRYEYFFFERLVYPRKKIACKGTILLPIRIKIIFAPFFLIDPLDPGTSWECNSCKKTEPANYVNAVIRSIGEEIVRLERGSPEACQSFVRKHSQNLHPNHYYLMDVKLALCQMIGGQGSGIDLHDLHEKDIVQKQKLCMEILNVANKISPGTNVHFMCKMKLQTYLLTVILPIPKI